MIDRRVNQLVGIKLSSSTTLTYKSFETNTYSCPLLTHYITEKRTTLNRRLVLSLFQLITSALLNNSVFFVNIQGNHIFQWFQVEKDYNMSKTPYVDAVSTSLPSVLSDLLTSFDTISLDKLETLIRFCTGATCPPRIAGHAGAWTSGQTRAQSQLSVLNQKTGEKRNRPDDEVGEAGTSTANGSGAPSKKQKLGLTDSADDSKALYTLHSVSVAAPIRKKVDVSIRKEAIHLSNPSSGSL